MSEEFERSEAGGSEELDFPIECGTLLECFLFDLRQPASRWGLFVRWFVEARYRAVVSFRMTQLLRRRGWVLLARWLEHRAYRMSGAELHYEARIGPRIRLAHPNGVVIGAGVVIEPDVTILQQVTLGGPGREVDSAGPRKPRVGRGANLYAGAKIIGPYRIGPGASVAANAVVISDVPEGALAAGVPARIIDRDRDRRDREAPLPEE